MKAASEKKPASGARSDDPARREREGGLAKPKDGDTDDPAHPDTPPWLVSLPEEYRRMITSGDTENVPQRYRHLVEAYQKWLAEHAKASPGR